MTGETICSNKGPVAVLRPSDREEGGGGRGADETEREEARVRRAAMMELQVRSIEALGEAWPSSEHSQGEYRFFLIYTNTP